MKSLFTTRFRALALLTLVLCTAIILPIEVYAQTPATPAAPSIGTTLLQTASAVANPGMALGQALGSNAPAAVAGAQNIVQCVSDNGLWGCILTGLTYFLFQVAATILGVVGLIFNWVVTVTVFQFATYFANSHGFLVAWGILRDIGNIMLLFGFIFMGIATILDIQNYGAWKALPALLIFAVLLNFSLFASEAVVDVANALSSSFYNQAGSVNEGASGCTSVGSGQTNSTQGASGCTSVGIAGQILAASGLDTIWNSNVTAILKNGPSGEGPLVMFLLAIFCLIAAVVLLAGAVMLFVRAIYLVFLLIVSPLGFAAMAIPPLQKMAGGWWRNLLSQAFFAPVFLLLIFVSLEIMTTFENTSGIQSTSFAQAVTAPSSGNVGIFFAFALVCGFMIASVIAAKKMGGVGSDFVVKNSTNVIGRATGAATAGTAGWVGRRTIGAASSFTGRQIAKTGFGRSEFGRALVGVVEAPSHRSFDLRNTQLAKGVAKSAKVDIGAPSKTASGGIHQIQEEAKTARTKYASRLRMNAEEKETDEHLKKQIEVENETWKKDNSHAKDIEDNLKDKQKNDNRRLEDLQAEYKKADLAEKAAKENNDTDGEKKAAQNKTALQTQMSGLSAIIESEAGTLKGLQDAREKAEKAHIQALLNLNKQIQENDPRAKYAKSMENSIFAPWPSVGAFANREAAEEILRELRKSKTEKAIESLKASVEKAGKTTSQQLGAVEEAVREEAEAEEATPESGAGDGTPTTP